MLVSSTAKALIPATRCARNNSFALDHEQTKVCIHAGKRLPVDSRFRFKEHIVMRSYLAGRVILGGR